MALFDWNRDLYVRVKAEDSTAPCTPSSCHDYRVIWHMKLAMPCDFDFQLELTTPGDFTTPISHTIISLNYEIKINYPSYRVKCIQTKSMTYQFKDSTTNSFVSWVYNLSST